MSGATALNPWNTPVRLSVTMRCHSARSQSWICGHRAAARVVVEQREPAELLVRVEPRPRASASKSVTSTAYAIPSIASATSSARSSSTSTTATRAPSAAMRRHVAAPIPDAPPVTNAR